MEIVITHIYLIPLLTSAFLSLKSFRLSWPIAYRYFSILLWVMFFFSVCSILWKYVLHETPYWSYTKSNYWLINIYFIPQYVLYFLFFYHVFEEKSLKKIILYTGGIFIIFGLINLIFIQGTLHFNSYTFVFAYLVNVILSIRYFNSTLNKEQQGSVSLLKSPLTWIMLGVFVDHSANIPFVLGLEFLSAKNFQLAYSFFKNIYLVINVLMLILFTIAYTCKPPQQK